MAHHPRCHSTSASEGYGADAGQRPQRSSGVPRNHTRATSDEQCPALPYKTATTTPGRGNHYHAQGHNGCDATSEFMRTHTACPHKGAEESNHTGLLQREALESLGIGPSAERPRLGPQNGGRSDSGRLWNHGRLPGRVRCWRRGLGALRGQRVWRNGRASTSKVEHCAQAARRRLGQLCAFIATPSIVMRDIKNVTGVVAVGYPRRNLRSGRPAHIERAVADGCWVEPRPTSRSIGV